MNKTKRLGLILTENEKYWVVHLAEHEGGLSQAALIHRLIHRAVKEHGLSELTLNPDIKANSAVNDHLDSETELAFSNAPYSGINH